MTTSRGNFSGEALPWAQTWPSTEAAASAGGWSCFFCIRHTIAPASGPKQCVGRSSGGHRSHRDKTYEHSPREPMSVVSVHMRMRSKLLTKIDVGACKIHVSTCSTRSVLQDLCKSPCVRILYRILAQDPCVGILSKIHVPGSVTRSKLQNLYARAMCVDSLQGTRTCARSFANSMSPDPLCKTDVSGSMSQHPCLWVRIQDLCPRILCKIHVSVPRLSSLRCRPSTKSMSQDPVQDPCLRTR